MLRFFVHLDLNFVQGKKYRYILIHASLFFLINLTQDFLSFLSENTLTETNTLINYMFAYSLEKSL